MIYHLYKKRKGVKTLALSFFVLCDYFKKIWFWNIYYNDKSDLYWNKP